MTIPKAKADKAIIYAILAALLYALNAPISKLLLTEIPPAFMASFLYLGAGLLMLPMIPLRKRFSSVREDNLERSDLPAAVLMVLLDIVSPILLMYGLTMTAAANASLLNNFEIVATSLTALLIFRERISKKLWVSIALVTAAGLLLSFESAESLSFSVGSLLVLAACVCWGFENNCTRRLSSKDPLKIVIIKGIFSGLGSGIVALISGEKTGRLSFIPLALILGFFAYGLSIFFYVRAQRDLGAAKTSAFYALSPFIAAAVSIAFSGTLPDVTFFIAAAIMAVGTYLAVTDRQKNPII